MPIKRAMKDERQKAQNTRAREPDKNSIAEIAKSVCNHFYSDTFERIVSIDSKSISKQNWMVSIQAKYQHSIKVENIEDSITKSLQAEFLGCKFQVRIERVTIKWVAN